MRVSEVQSRLLAANVGIPTIKLNLGCGRDLIDGYVNLDFFSQDPDVLRMDIRKLDLPSDYADELYSNHSLEYLPFPETLSILQDWYRVLKPGGRIELRVTDLEWCVRSWLASPETERWGTLHKAIFGAQENAGEVHCTSFSHERIISLLQDAGFVNITTKPIKEYDRQSILAKALKPTRMETTPQTLNAESAAGHTKPTAIRLNLGCGKDLKEGYINVDLFAESPNVLKMDIRNLNLPSNFADEIYSSHSLEHLPAPETLPILRGWFRVLKPGGIIKLNIPDAEWCLKNWLDLPEAERWGYSLSAIYGVQNNAGQIHYTSFTHERIRSLLQEVGFVQVTTKPVEAFDQQCIWVEAIKPNCAETVAVSPATSPAIETIVSYYHNPLPGVQYDILLTNELKHQLSVLTEHKTRLVNEFKLLEDERDFYKTRWERLINFLPLKPFFAIRDCLRKGWFL